MNRPRAVAAATLLTLSACTDGAAQARRWVRAGDTVMRDVRMAGSLTDKNVGEASGVVASKSEPGVFWVLNDSGNDERLFAIDSTGRSVGEVRVNSAKNRDWEALASGPCAEGTCLFIGDLGDNQGSRGNLAVHRVREPSKGGREASVLATLTLAYQDGPHDVEAMYAGPDGSLWLVTKRPARGANGKPRPSRVYHVLPSAWQQTGRYTAPLVDSVPVVPLAGDAREFITDASLSALQADGSRRLVLLSYGAVHVFDADPATGRPGRLLARCSLPIPDDYAEGVSWLADGRILLVNEGKRAPLYTGRCP
ncbi:MAG: hypothetical protein HEQ38_11750 [Gemmatimonas sp.]|nr:hypothetical protein [Gemmatimonas sp.]